MLELAKRRSTRYAFLTFEETAAWTVRESTTRRIMPNQYASCFQDNLSSWGHCSICLLCLLRPVVQYLYCGGNFLGIASTFLFTPLGLNDPGLERVTRRWSRKETSKK
jgi:hypothetical protein